MTASTWHKSLYWRIAAGFIICVAVLLALQAALFIWLAGRGRPSGFAQSPQHLATVVSSDLSAALEANAALDVGEYVREHFGSGPHRILVVFDDGRMVSNSDQPPPDWMVVAANRWLRRDWRPFPPPPPPPPNAPPSMPRPPMRDGREGPGRPRRLIASPIVVGNRPVGLVAIVPTRPPPYPVLREFGPALAVAGIALLIAATATMSFFVFRPARRRLLSLQRAAEAISAGDTGARAPERGGDEVASLATAFNRMAGDLESRVHELQESDRSRRQLLADVSHELMTPLTAMRGYLETLSIPEAVRNDETRERYLRVVTDETLRLEAIIGDLLDLARLESGGAALEREPIAVEQLFARAAERHEGALDEKSITLRTRIDPGAETISGDARRLEQAVQNLVANAVRHTPGGGRIDLVATPVDGGRVRVIVQDTGPGIPDEHLPRIFDRFYRVDTARDPASGGSGLGLSIVRAIIEAHGGTITASSPPAGGARFEIELAG
jgi:signal transduction histidine kinase